MLHNQPFFEDALISKFSYFRVVYGITSSNFNEIDINLYNISVFSKNFNKTEIYVM